MKKMMVLALVMWGMLAMIGAQLAWGEEAFVYPAADASLAVLQQQLALAPSDYYKVVISYRIDFLQNGEPTTFSEACARIDTVINAVNPKYYDDGKLNLKKQYGFFAGKFQLERLAYCQANPSSYDFHIAIRDKTEWGFQAIANCLLNYKYSPTQAIQGIDYLNRQAIALDKSDAEVLALLKKLNRVFSALLTTDQAAWEKVVAQVRTLMETYE